MKKPTFQGVQAADLNTDLPEGWTVVSSADIFTFVTSGSRGWAKYYSDTGALFLRIANLDHNSITLDLAVRKYVRPPRSAEGTRTRVKVGDLLISITADVGMIGLVQGDLGEAYINQHIALARPAKCIDRRYLAWYITSTPGQKQLEELQRGATRAGLGLEDIRAINIPLAPMAEQQRVVARIESLLGYVNGSRNRLAKISKILRAFRQSVLSAACSGLLTEDWREHNAITEDTAVTIEAILRRREADATTPTQKKRLQDVYDKGEGNDSGELPENWRYVTLNKLCASFDYGTSGKSQPSGKVPVLRMGNVQNGEIDWTELVYTSDREEIREYSLQPNTVLFNRTNSPELVGKTAIYRGERPAIFAGYLIRIINEPELDPDYLNLCLNTAYARKFCSRVRTDGVSQSNINAQKLGLFQVPYCPIGEQREIVRRVGALFRLADIIEKRAEVATGRVEKLTQAILVKAFRGQLVPTEAVIARQEGREFEPASVLFERIEAERGKTKVPSNGANRKRRVVQSGEN